MATIRANDTVGNPQQRSVKPEVQATLQRYIEETRQ